MPDPIIIDVVVTSAPAAIDVFADASVVAVDVVTAGPQGPQGEPGPSGSGSAADPGDLTLVFENHLI